MLWHLPITAGSCNRMVQPNSFNHTSGNYVMDFHLLQIYIMQRGWMLMNLVMTFHLAPPWGWQLWILVKCLDKAMKCGLYIHVPLRMNCHMFGVPLSFHLVPLCVQYFYLYLQTNDMSLSAKISAQLTHFCPSNLVNSVWNISHFHLLSVSVGSSRITE